MNNKVAIYCRLSEEDKNKKHKDDDSGSIQNQKLMLTEYAFNQGWIVYDIYSDDDYAGSDRTRPAFNRMIEDAKAKRFNIILCKTQSRFTRELEIVEAYIHNLFPTLGIRFVSVVDNIDTDIAGNKKARQINGLINEWYLEDMSESIKAALRTRMKAGYFIGSFAPYGYRKDPDMKGHLVIDDEAADVVREIFSLYTKGMGRTGIARILNERGIPSPAEYYRIHGIKSNIPAKRNAKYWKNYTVSHILSNEVYIGNLVQGKSYNPTYKVKHSMPADKEAWVRKEHTHEPIIDIPTWELVRQLWSIRSRPCYTGETNPFSGILVCGECGYHMGIAYNNHKRYFRCQNAKYGRVCCTGTSIFETTLQKAVLQQARTLRNRYLDENSIDSDCIDMDISASRIQSMQQTISDCDRKLKEIGTALKNLYIDKLKGIISIEQFKNLSDEFDKERIGYETEIAILQSEIENEQRISGNADKKMDFIEKVLSFDTVSREFIHTFIRRIEVSGTRKNRKIDIYWNI